MEGFNSITCSTSGNWTDRPPTCTVRCPMPVTPKHARFSTGQTLLEFHVVGDVITYECIHDATRANETMVCGYYGSWEVVKGKEQCPGACESNPCFGAATCDNNRIDPEIGYICYCPLGFEGQNCELQQSGVTTPLCGQNFYNRTGVITSPNYPNNYDNNNNCTYLIRVSRTESIHFTVHEFMSETGKDYLSYGEGYSVYPDPGSTHADYPMLSGYTLVRKNATFDFEWDNIWLHWHTDSEYSKKGFNISYSTKTPTCELDPTGVKYRGNLSQTKTGYTCQNWIAQYPHEHLDFPTMFPNSGIGDHNYCRNPDGENTAWCYTTDLSVRWELCAVGYLDPECMTTPFCELHPTGVNYRGNLSQTISGYTCQHWTAQHPHNHSWIPSLYSYRGLGDHNYCRNPGGETTAWCYTTDPSVRWELCAVGYLDPDCMATPFEGTHPCE
ncbi:CUB and sushi domain-containing protein 2-like [Lytechinus variegatus]|uniref:CUB and sushi domain-containing protein 2-like n=1 Tax=Lytechinus variegatus TaxID=7654 RepID=UPI001BB15EC2|nr:CUB and sushi domain-containing protein 2-like [Lytechinus variegatus]